MAAEQVRPPPPRAPPSRGAHPASRLCSKLFDVAVAFEERVFDLILEDVSARGGKLMQPLLVINLDVRDNATEAGLAAPLALSLCQSLQAAAAGPGGWEGALEALLLSFEKETGRRPLYAIGWY